MELSSGDYASITLYAHPSCPRNHRVRVVIAEKEVVHKKVLVRGSGHPPEELLAVNPAGNLPTLIDRHLVISDIGVIENYLDERFPYPPLLPVEPRDRAHLRIMIKYIEKEWYGRVNTLLKSRTGRIIHAARKELEEDILAHANLFKSKWFFSDKEFLLLDCVVAPILWRLASLKIHLQDKKTFLPIRRYMKRLFIRNGFRHSLSEEELELFDEAEL